MMKGDLGKERQARSRSIPLLTAGLGVVLGVGGCGSSSAPQRESGGQSDIGAAVERAARATSLYSFRY
jgi:hypothetical protein